MAGARERVENLLRSADIQVDGSHPWDIQVHDERFYSRILAGGKSAPDGLDDSTVVF